MIRLIRELIAEVPHARRMFWAAVGLSVLAAVAAVTLMAASGWLISRAAEQPPVLYLQVAIVTVRACGLFRGLFRYAERLVSHELALQVQSALRLRTYRSLAQTTLLSRRRGDLLTRIVTDVESIQDLVVRVALPFASAGLVTVTASIAITVVSPVAGVALLTSAVLAGAVVPAVARWASRSVDRAAVPARGELSNAVAEVNRAAADLAAYGDTTRLAAVAEVDARLRRAEERAALVRGVAAGVQVLAAGFAVLVALAVGVPAVAAGQLARVNLAVLVLTPLALHEVLAPLAQSAQALTRAAAGLDRVRAVLDASPVGSGDRIESSPSEHPGITVDALAVGWPGAPAVVSDITFRVATGERVALVGPSGAGKTTIAATLLGLIPPKAGSAVLDGRVGYLAQDAHIFNTTVAENVRIGNIHATDGELAAAVRRAGLDLSVNRMVGEEGGELSGGEARRLAMARLLVGRHQVWILDEPTEHLDRATADALMGDLWAAASDAPILVITHDPNVIVSCHRVFRLGRSPAQPGRRTRDGNGRDPC